MINRTLSSRALLAICILLMGSTAPAQTQNAPKQAAQGSSSDFSGMYSFLNEGEFVQISIDSQGHVSGFISRYDESESERGLFVDQFLKDGKLDGNRLTFSTETVHGISFEFHGTVERGAGKKPGDEAYYVLKGTLTENSSGGKDKSSTRSQEVAFKMFPQDLGSEPAKK